MRYITVKDTEWTYPDQMEYASAGQELVLHSARNSFAAGQILIEGVGEAANISVDSCENLSIFTLEKYELVSVMVEDNPHMTEENSTEFTPVRKAPYRLYDCLKPLEQTIKSEGGVAGLYLAFEIPFDSEDGIYEGIIKINIEGQKLEIPVSLTIYRAVVPKQENLKIINGLRRNFDVYHDVANDSHEADRLESEYIKMLRRARQNMMYVGGVEITSRPDENGNGEYAFDFSALEARVERLMAHGIEYFNMSSIGGRKSWKESIILVGGLPAMSFEGYKYLSAYLPALQSFLEEKGWIDRFTIGVADEPNNENAVEYRALCGLIRKLAPKLRLLDALGFTPVWGALDIWVPQNADYQLHREEFEAMRTKDSEIWMYVCCVPRGKGYINRFMDYPLLSTRYLFWGNYKYNLKGYLHWAANVYQPGQNPFEQNCPSHKNADSVTILPPGDTHIIYPGESSPWMSMRLEAQRASAEDYELLCAIAAVDKEKADELCSLGFEQFDIVDYDVNRFEETRIALFKAASEI